MAENPTCSVCGKPVDPKQSLMVDKRKGTRIFTHIECKTASKSA